MSEINFEETETYTAPPRQTHQTQPKGLTALLIARGIAKNEKQAALMLIGISIVCIVAMALVWWPRGSEIQYTTTPEDLGKVGGPQDLAN